MPTSPPPTPAAAAEAGTLAGTQPAGAALPPPSHAGLRAAAGSAGGGGSSGASSSASATRPHSDTQSVTAGAAGCEGHAPLGVTSPDVAPRCGGLTCCRADVRNGCGTRQHATERGVTLRGMAVRLVWAEASHAGTSPNGGAARPQLGQVRLRPADADHQGRGAPCTLEAEGYVRICIVCLKLRCARHSLGCCACVPKLFT